MAALSRSAVHTQRHTRTSESLVQVFIVLNLSNVDSLHPQIVMYLLRLFFCFFATAQHKDGQKQEVERNEYSDFQNLL